MNAIISLQRWIDLIVPFYHPSEKMGRLVRGIEIMLRVYLMQVWFNLSDAGIEDAIYDSYAMRKFLGINFIDEQVPDATTLLKFRHLMERNEIGKAIFEDIKKQLDDSDLIMHGDTIVDTTIVSASSSTKNRIGERDPEMHQVKMAISDTTS